MVKYKPEWSDVKTVFWFGFALGLALGLLILGSVWTR